MKVLKKLSLFVCCCVAVLVFVGCSGSGTNYQNLSGMIEVSYPKVVSIKLYQNSLYTSAGSGVIVYASDTFSLVATNYHVVEQVVSKQASCEIINWSDELYQGKLDTDKASDMSKYTSSRLTDADVVYYNSGTDLAIIKYLPPATSGARGKFANLRKSDLRVGEPVAALGFSLGSYYRSAVGTVSEIRPVFRYRDEYNVQRERTDVFMHDAITINGNSGGPVFDAEGNVIGLTTMVAAMASGDALSGANTHDHDVLALGFSVAISSRHIINVLDTNKVAWGL